MNDLHTFDWIVIGIYLAVTVSVGLVFRRRASRSADQYFLAGRSLPWWIVGTSMVATTFAADTPLAVTGFIREHGVWFNWFGWHYVLSQMLAVFLFARFWRRAGVLTDNELIELRYSGKPAAALRAFKASYFAVLYNLIVMGWVLLGLGTVAEAVLDVPREVAIPVGAALALSYALLAGFWGVVMTDVVQFALAMFGAVALAVCAVCRVGGLEALRTELATSPLASEATTAMVPSGGLSLDSDFVRFLIFVTVMWWASHNADGGGYLIQRMSAAKDERHARGATLWFAVANNALRYWPWIIAALASMVLIDRLPEGSEAEAAYPLLMKKVLGPGLLGVMLVSFFAAFMSTIDTHLNWGASYLVNDVYKRFLDPGAGPHRTVIVSKVFVAVLLVLAVMVALAMTSIGKAWLFVWAMGAGIGPVLILRWFWWRLNAWSEIAALASSVIAAVGFEVATVVQAGADYRLFDTPLHVSGVALGTHHKALILVPFSMVCWLATTFLTRPVERDRLIAFVRKVRPGGRWGPVADEVADVRQDGLRPGIVVAWLSGVALVYGLTFGIGQLLIGDPRLGAALLGAAALGGVGVARELRRVRP